MSVCELRMWEYRLRGNHIKFDSEMSRCNVKDKSSIIYQFYDLIGGSNPLLVTHGSGTYRVI